jgi:replicative DNA helicase
VIVDYLMRIRGYGSLDANDRASLLTNDLFELKRELDCAFILIHHMNRSIEHRGSDSEPQLSDLNEGGERDPDIVAFLVPDKGVTQVGPLIPMKMVFAKHRGGPTGYASLLFKGSCTTFITAVPRYISLKGV